MPNNDNELKIGQRINYFHYAFIYYSKKITWVSVKITKRRERLI